MYSDSGECVVGRGARHGDDAFDHLAVVARFDFELLRHPFGGVVDESQALPSAQRRDSNQGKLGRYVVRSEVDADLRRRRPAEGDAAKDSAAVLGEDQVLTRVVARLSRILVGDYHSIHWR